MPKRNDIKSILILGAGPIVIGQACEFDYSGVQACKALREEGYKIILVNSNPATIMTDPNIADVTYIQPIQWEIVLKIIEKELPNAILPTMGGQTALNCALDLANQGILSKFNITMIGASAHSIRKAENREMFNQSMKHIGLETARYGIASSMEEAYKVIKDIGFPCVIRPSYTMGGSGGGIAYSSKDFDIICQRGLQNSLNNQLLIDESLIGWKEYEMEVIRDSKDNCIIVCSIENFDPMGIHTGDSITVAPAQTLNDKEYQIMRNASIAVLKEIGVNTGGANVQFAVNPIDGRLIIIEMNPRVSRSSALASKATGFPIAKVAAKLAIGYTLDELINDITGGLTPASFEPSIDYVVTKVPRFNFEKFHGVNDKLTTQMKSVGEVMAIGRTFQESIQKALCGLEIGICGFEEKINILDTVGIQIIYDQLKNAGSERILYIADAFRANISIKTINKITHIDPWFLMQIKELINLEKILKLHGLKYLTKEFIFLLKRKGFTDKRLSYLTNVNEQKIRNLRWKFKIHPVYKRVDTCAAEFATNTAYLYSTYEDECESQPNQDRKKIVILGSGPNRIGQGIEFDYCCVHASLALREDNYETIIINCNPETVSTDYDISDRLYFDPIILENILEIIRIEKPHGVIIQFGGQTPLQLAKALELAGVPIIGTNPDVIDRVEDRGRFKQVVKKLNLKQPLNAIVNTINQAIIQAIKIGYPLIVRPSYVLGGCAMKIAYDERDLKDFFSNAISVSNNSTILLDNFLTDAIEVDVDVVCDGKNILIGGIMEHIEQAGIHSGDSACSLPPHTLNQKLQNIIRHQIKQLAFELNIIGLMNVQFAIKNDNVYLIEVNPRAARTVPFVSKATGIPLAKIAARVMVGCSLTTQGMLKEIIPSYFSVKKAVLPFNKFQEVDPILGPEMRSTGEVMGIGRSFKEAFAKALLSINNNMKKTGCVLLSLNFGNKVNIIEIAKKLKQLNFTIDATKNTFLLLKTAGIDAKLVHNINEAKPNIQDFIKQGKYIYIINTSIGHKDIENSKLIRQSAIKYNIHCDTNLNASLATLISLEIDPTEYVISLQDIYLQYSNY